MAAESDVCTAAARRENEATAGESPHSLQGALTDLYRRPAIEAWLRQGDAPSDPLMLPPVWSRLAFWLVLSIAGAAIALLLFAEVNQYAAGPALVSAGRRYDLLSPTSGIVSSVEVRPGKPVAAGQVLLRFDDSQQRDELARLDREFELQLIRGLQDPADAGAEAALIALGVPRELARAKVDERVVVAVQAGTVADVNVRPGQYVGPGELLATLTADDAMPTVLVVLPASYSPRLRPGMPVELRMEGYQHSYQTAEVEAVGNQAVGPSEIKRFLGPQLADTLPLSGSSVILRARLPGLTFRSGREVYRYHSGMRGQASVRLSSERLVLTVFPWLKALTD